MPIGHRCDHDTTLTTQHLTHIGCRDRHHCDHDGETRIFCNKVQSISISKRINNTKFGHLIKGYNLFKITQQICSLHEISPKVEIFNASVACDACV